MPSDTFYSMIKSPLGDLLVSGNGEAVTRLYMEVRRWGPGDTSGWRRDDALFATVRHQLDEYFAGELLAFDLPLAPAGTPFQQRVWNALSDIPFGDVVSYGTIARRLEAPSAVRAVGAANGRNPISIVIPCHRVVAANGSLTGYGGGLERKNWLLEHEARVRAARGMVAAGARV
ncbi:MAG: methylated-DNA--[protein]-cysteine S-methyltransferase [Gemmatimonadaceae bacterium]